MHEVTMHKHIGEQLKRLKGAESEVMQTQHIVQIFVLQNEESEHIHQGIDDEQILRYGRYISIKHLTRNYSLIHHDQYSTIPCFHLGQQLVFRT